MRMTAAVLHEQGRPAPFAESRPFAIEEVEIEGPGPGEARSRQESSPIEGIVRVGIRERVHHV